MGVLYGRYELLDQLTAYKVRPAPKYPPGKFETGTGNFEGMCGVLGALEYIEWVGETFGEEQAERYAWDYTGRRLRFKQGMAAIRSYEFELSRILFDKTRCDNERRSCCPLELVLGALHLHLDSCPHI